MTSVLAWLDFSERDQRRARELIQLFLQPESRDELGIGTVRDALSDLLFPGISVIQTRARYFLFTPWLFKEGARRGRRGRDLLNWVERWQRIHVETLRNNEALEGLRSRGETVRFDDMDARMSSLIINATPDVIICWSWNSLLYPQEET